MRRIHTRPRSRCRARRAGAAACAPGLGRFAITATVRARRGARRGGARLREVIVDLPPHPLDLLRERVGELRLPGGAARSASCASTASGVFRPCARSPALASARWTACVAMLEQRVEIVDERLHLRRIASLDPALAPRVHAASRVAQLRERTTGRGAPARTRPASEQHDQHQRRWPRDPQTVPCRTTAIVPVRGSSARSRRASPR